MHTFRDNKGRKWSIKLNYRTAKMVTEELDINLFALDYGEPSLFTRLFTDGVLMIELLYTVCHDEIQFREKDMDVFKFATAMESQPTESSKDHVDYLGIARMAFLDTLSDFFRRLGSLGQAVLIDVQSSQMRAVIAELVQAGEPQDDVSIASVDSPESTESTPETIPGES